MTSKSAVLERTNGSRNKLLSEDRQAHDWYRFVLSYPPHLVRDYLQRFEMSRAACARSVLRHRDDARRMQETRHIQRRHRSQSDGLFRQPRQDRLERGCRRADPACRVGCRQRSEPIAGGRDRGRSDFCRAQTAHATLRVLAPAQEKLLLGGSISPLPLHKTLVLLEVLEAQRDARFHDLERLGACQGTCSVHRQFALRPGSRRGRAKPDAPVISPWLAGVHAMAGDLRGSGRTALDQSRDSPSAPTRGGSLTCLNPRAWTP